MDFKSYLETNARNIDEQLDLILSDFLNETKKTNIKLLPFALGLLNSCKGGKRIRGILVKLGYEIASGPSDLRNDVVRIGAAFEILHSALLIHDDIIDKSPTRRGKPSLYKSLGGDHYGISQAITLGDIGLYLPVKLISETSFLGEYKLKVLDALSQIVMNTGWGQIMDVEKSDDVLFIQTFKTAEYTIAGPLQIGAILAGADEKLLKLLGKFGENLGIAFQIKDDILDGEGGKVDSLKIKALEYAAKAKNMTKDITADPKMERLLNQITQYLVERTK